MKQVIHLGLVLLLLLGLPGYEAAARWLPSQSGAHLQGVCPSVQNTPFFTLAYGAVTLDGASASVGTIVEARSPRGDVVGCFEVTTTGNYGMMYIYGEDNTVTPSIPGMRAGETVAFYVNGSPATASPTLTWSNDKTWHEVNLTAVGTPNADFSGTPRQGIPSMTVTFTNLSTGTYTSCAWDFGNGESSTNCGSPSHTYTAPGSYSVSLTVSGALGDDTETKMGYIAVHTPVDAQFSGTPTSGVAPLAVTFSNASTGDYTTCAWNFGDGGTSDACNPSAYTYHTPGVYNVSLTVSGLGGSDTETKTGYITVYTPVNAQFSGTPAAGVAPLAVTFTNASTGDYTACTWAFGDGSTSNLCLPPAHTYTTPGTYTVTLTVSGPGGTDTEIQTDYITVYTPVNAQFSASPAAGVAPLAVTFTNQSTGDYTACLWDFGDGGTSSACAPPTYTYDAPGVYTVSLTISGPGGTDTESKSAYVTVYESPVAAFSGAPTSGPAPLLVTFTNLSTGGFTTCTWAFDDGNGSNACSEVSHSYTAVGAYTVTLTVSGPGGADTHTEFDYVTVSEPVQAAFSGVPTSGSAPLTVAFTNASSGPYESCEWDFGDGTVVFECDDPTHVYAAAGTYTVTLTVSAAGGSDTEAKTGYIVVYASPTADFSATPTAGGAPLSVNLTNLSTGDFSTCSWAFGEGNTSNSCAPPPHTYEAPGVYTVILAVSGSGGSDTETKLNYITVHAPPSPDFIATPLSGVAPLEVSFTNQTAGAYDTCLWAFGDGGSSTNCNPQHTYTTPGTYTVLLMVSGPGGSDSVSKSQYITVHTPVNSAFSAEPTSGVAPLAVTFTNQATGDYGTCLWDFGDGNTSDNCTPPAYTYITPGVYTVTLSVSGPGGNDTEIKSQYITIYTALQADFSATPVQGVAPLVVTFTNLSLGDYSSCVWNFGDGITSTMQHPTHTYTTTGVYTVSLSIQGTAGEDVKSRTEFITVAEQYVVFLPLVIRGN